MNQKRRITYLIGIMLIMMTLTLIFSISLLYNTAFKQEEIRLVEITKSQARLIEVMEESDRNNSSNASENAMIYTLKKLKKAHKNFEGFEEKVEFIIGHRKKDSIEFAFTHSNRLISNPMTVHYSSEMAKPIVLALNGESGTATTVDYYGEVVLCAYEPMELSGGMKCALVTKIDKIELQLPFINTGLLAAGLSVIMIFFGVFLFRRVGDPLLRTIEKEHQQFTSLFDSATEGFVVVNQQGEIQMLNPASLKMFGYSSSELIGKKIEVLIPKRFIPKHVDYRQEYIRNPEPRTMGREKILYILRKDGEEFPVEISLNSFKSGNDTMILAVISDITELRKSKTELQRLNKELEDLVAKRTEELNNTVEALIYSNESLQEEIKIRKKIQQEVQRALSKEKELNELKSRFVSMASHEFRTPLSTMLSSVTLLQDYAEPVHKEKRDKHINRIVSNIGNLNTILNDFLSLDKLEHGKIKNEPADFDMVSFCEEMIEEIQPVLKKGQSISHSHIGKKIVFLDRQILKKVLSNLLTNAIKFSYENDSIQLETEMSAIELTIKVIDKGIGIPEKDQKNMFERFFRAKNTTNIQGTGLGLSIVNKFVTIVKGSITFESREGQGTTFIVKIPKTL